MWTTKKQTRHRSGSFAGNIIGLDPLSRIANGSNSMRQIECRQRIVPVDVEMRINQAGEEGQPFPIDCFRPGRNSYDSAPTDGNDLFPAYHDDSVLDWG